MSSGEVVDTGKQSSLISLKGVSKFWTSPENRFMRRVMAIGCFMTGAGWYLFMPDSTSSEVTVKRRTTDGAQVTGHAGTTDDQQVRDRVRAEDHASYEAAVSGKSGEKVFTASRDYAKPNVDPEPPKSTPPAPKEDLKKELGTGFIPPETKAPTRLKSYLTKSEPPEPQPAPVAAKPTRTPLQVAAAAAVKRHLKEREEGPKPSRRFFTSNLVYSRPQTESDSTANISEAERTPSTRSEANVAAGAIETSPEQDVQVLKLEGGRFIYGITVTRINTDYPQKEVVGELVGGPFSGARIIGTWKVLGKWTDELSLVFDRMFFRGKKTSIKMVAFDPGTKLPGFVDEIDRHILLRYGGLLLGAIGEAAKEKALAQANVSKDYQYDLVTGEVDTVSSSLSDEDLDQVFYGTLGEKLFSNLKNLYERPITRKVNDLRDMQLLVMDNIEFSLKGDS